MALNSIAVATRVRLVELISDALPGVQVEYAWPAQELEPRAIWLGRLRSKVEIEVMKVGRQKRTDLFTIDVWCSASGVGYTNAVEADLAAEELVHAVEDVLALDPTLGSLDGLVACTLSEREGDPDPTDRGWAAAVKLTLSCHARLS